MALFKRAAWIVIFIGILAIIIMVTTSSIPHRAMRAADLAIDANGTTVIGLIGPLLVIVYLIINALLSSGLAGLKKRGHEEIKNGALIVIFWWIGCFTWYF